MLEYRPRFLLTGEGVALRPLLLVAVAGLCIGMIPPLLWLAAWKSGHYIGDASGILDRLLPFYPFAIVNLAVLVGTAACAAFLLLRMAGDGHLFVAILLA